MKFLRSLVLGFALAATMFVTGGASQQQPKTLPVEQPKEYILGSCGRAFTVVHVVIDKVQRKVILGDYFMSDAKTVSPVEEPLVLVGYKQDVPNKDGDVAFHAQVKTDEGTQLELNGIYHGEKLIAILTVDKSLGHVLLYGHQGKIDDMTKDVEQDMQFCIYLHQIDQEQIPSELGKYLASDVKSDQ